jgi:hypothetical protein
MKILINLIGGQTIPNLIAQKYIKPEKIYLLFSESSKKQKDNYKAILSKIQFDEAQIEPYNYDNIKKEIMDYIHTDSNNEFVLNFTGGTKIMSLASFDIFKELNKKAIYIDSENGKIYNYKDGKSHTESIDIKITSEEYLKLNGHVYKIPNEKNLDDAKKEYYEYLENNYSTKISSLLNEVNHTFERNKLEFYNNAKSIERCGNKYFWDNDAKSSIVELNEKVFNIKGKDSIKYITGLWFEDLVYYKKIDGTKIYNEVIRNVHIQDRHGKQDMIELDVIGLHNNILHLFEFKSGKPRREAINNLKTIKEQLGKYTKLFLISYFKLAKNDPLINRMHELDIIQYDYHSFKLENCIKQTNINL